MHNLHFICSQLLYLLMQISVLNGVNTCSGIVTDYYDVTIDKKTQ